ncbi:hypothetical protein D3C76_1575720 [compost metagenome]
MQQFQQISQLVQQIDNASQTQSSFGGSSGYIQPSVAQTPFQSQSIPVHSSIGNQNFNPSTIGRGQQGMQ